MPYKNIVFVKLLWKELLHEDDRFIEKCNDEQKGLFLMLLLLAGATNNNIPESENYLKRTLNLSQSAEIVAENRDCLLALFPKLVRQDGYLKFKKFKGLHNYIRTAKGVPNDDETGTPRIDKNRIEEIRREYIKLKGWTNQTFPPEFYSRTGRAIKTLFSLSSDPAKIISCMKWVSQKWSEMWTIETCIKKWHDFAKPTPKPQRVYTAPKDSRFTFTPAKGEVGKLVEEIAKKKENLLQ